MRTVNHKRECGSALILVPVCMLMLISLGGLVIDSAAVYFEQRQMNDAATSLANRIATKAIDLDEYYGSDGNNIRIDPAKAAQMTVSIQNNLSSNYLSAVSVTPTIDGARVNIRINARARHIIMRSFPGVSNEVGLQAQAQAVLIRHP